MARPYLFKMAGPYSLWILKPTKIKHRIKIGNQFWLWSARARTYINTERQTEDKSLFTIFLKCKQNFYLLHSYIDWLYYSLYSIHRSFQLTKRRKKSSNCGGTGGGHLSFVIKPLQFRFVLLIAIWIVFGQHNFVCVAFIFVSNELFLQMLREKKPFRSLTFQKKINCWLITLTNRPKNSAARRTKI